MEDKKTPTYADQVNNYKAARNKYIVVFSYILVQFLLASVVVIIAAAIICRVKGLDSTVMTDCLAHFKTKEFDAPYVKTYYDSQAIGNFFGYFSIFVLIILLCKSVFSADFKMIKENKKFYFFFITLSTLTFALVALLVDKIVSTYAPSSENQSTIVSIISNGGYGMVLMSISVILAPIVEEFIYRHCIFHFLRKYHIAFSYIVSVVLFVLPHIITTQFSNFGTYVLQSTPYVISAIMLAFIYHKSNKNIYATIAAHMLNNIIALAQVFIYIYK